MPRTTSKRIKKKMQRKAVSRKKEVKKKQTKQKVPLKKEKKKYIEAIGRRKTATARVRIFPGIKERKFLINKQKINLYFTDFELQKVIFSPLRKTDLQDKFEIEVLVKGGGKKGQAEAIRLGLSRALIEKNEKLRGVLKAAGYLKRDPRMKERKKFGLKKARRAPQWQKR